MLTTIAVISQQAIDAYQNALGLDSNDADVYNNLGAAYFNLNQVN